MSFCIPWRLLIPDESVQTVIGTDGQDLQQQSGASVQLCPQRDARVRFQPVRCAFCCEPWGCVPRDPRTVSTPDEAPVTLRLLAFVGAELTLQCSDTLLR